MVASSTRRTLSQETPSWQSMQLWALSWVTVPGREQSCCNGTRMCKVCESNQHGHRVLDLREIASQVFVVSLGLELKQ